MKPAYRYIEFWVIVWMLSLSIAPAFVSGWDSHPTTVVFTLALAVLTAMTLRTRRETDAIKADIALAEERIARRHQGLSGPF